MHHIHKSYKWIGRMDPTQKASPPTPRAPCGAKKRHKRCMYYMPCSSAEIFLHFHPLNQDQSTLRGKLILVQIVVFLSLDNPELHRDTFHLVLHLVLRDIGEVYKRY